MRSPGITVTGADERTPIAELVRLTRLSPAVEIGLLYTETPEGRNRYPSTDWLEEAACALGDRCAVHVCGQIARACAVQGVDFIQQAGRVQVNGNPKPLEVCEFTDRYRQVITQIRLHVADTRAPAVVLPEWVAREWLVVPPERHSWLVDSSGGRGISPEYWHRPDTLRSVGFAGGLGPDNLAAELPRIAAVAREPWWVDMEGKLRTEDDWFSVPLAERAIQEFLRFSNEHAERTLVPV